MKGLIIAVGVILCASLSLLAAAPTKSIGPFLWTTTFVPLGTDQTPDQYYRSTELTSQLVFPSEITIKRLSVWAKYPPDVQDSSGSFRACDNDAMWAVWKPEGSILVEVASLRLGQSIGCVVRENFGPSANDLNITVKPNTYLTAGYTVATDNTLSCHNYPSQLVVTYVVSAKAK